MPKHLADKIAELKETIAKLEAAHKTETKDFRKVAKAHKAEGKKVSAKNLGKTGREKLRALHEVETDALEHMLGSHMNEGDKIKSVKKAVPRMKGAAAPIMKSAEAKPEPAKVEVPEIVKRGRGRPKGSKNKPKDTAVLAEVPAAKPEPAPKAKLVKIVEPGMAPAELAGRAPETGPQETAKPKAEKAEKKAKKAKKPTLEVKEVEIVVPPMPAAGKKAAEKKEKAEPKKMLAAKHLIEKGLITKENANMMVKKAKAEVDELYSKEVHSFEEDEERKRELEEAKIFRAAAVAAKGLLSKKKD